MSKPAVWSVGLARKPHSPSRTMRRVCGCGSCDGQDLSKAPPSEGWSGTDRGSSRRCAPCSSRARDLVLVERPTANQCATKGLRADGDVAECHAQTLQGHRLQIESESRGISTGHDVFSNDSLLDCFWNFSDGAAGWWISNMEEWALLI